MPKHGIKKKISRFMPNSFFITATDTDAGKTFVTAGLVRSMQRRKLNILALKPMACGYDEGQLNTDLVHLLDAQGLANNQVLKINLYHFQAPLAPWQSGLLEGQTIDSKKLLDWCETQGQSCDVKLIEGVGGLMVPLSKYFNVADWLVALQPMPTLLVVRVKLGGINHMLLSLEALKQRGIQAVCVILNDADNSGQAMLQYHQQALMAYDANLNHTLLPYKASSEVFDDLCQTLIEVDVS